MIKELVTIRLHYVEMDGRVVNGRRELRRDQCGGMVPPVGDEMLLPLAVGESLSGAPRQLLTVLRRIFSPRDLPDYVALVRHRPAPFTDQQHAFETHAAALDWLGIHGEGISDAPPG